MEYLGRRDRRIVSHQQDAVDDMEATTPENNAEFPFVH